MTDYRVWKYKCDLQNIGIPLLPIKVGDVPNINEIKHETGEIQNIDEYLNQYGSYPNKDMIYFSDNEGNYWMCIVIISKDNQINETYYNLYKLEITNIWYYEGQLDLLDKNLTTIKESEIPKIETIQTTNTEINTIDEYYNNTNIKSLYFIDENRDYWRCIIHNSNSDLYRLI